ncbi:glycosyltransferase [candidate division KSB3 bacterium]|uniref:Glycosyltransferase n=1 Tax=candidate division KSB3 bacterium TaxID=2044937 RepID=A0A9D5JZY8_9BACT|nr:glycosyltransferase [candidate division KSB3 bacterium]MBD3327213.1 glycosyltransferase [candidate division KSB3 bacterium]
MDKTRKINIGYIVNAAKIGGANRSMETLARGLRGTQFASYFAVPAPGPMIDLLRSLDLPVEVHELSQPAWTEPVQTYRHWREWGAFLDAHQLGLVHANGLHAGRSVVLAAAVRKIPLLCHIRFHITQDYCRWIFRRLPKPAGFIFISQAIQDEVGLWLSQACPAARQWIVYNGVDTQTFTPAPISNAIPRIGIIANLQPIKGHEDFLDMAALLTQAGKHVHYDIIGADVQQQGRFEALTAYADQLGLADNVHFHGHVSNVAEVAKQLDIVVCASHVEPFGRCLIEGMACGKPVVATRVGGIPEVIADRHTGLLVPAHDPRALAEAVTALLEDETMRTTMGIQGRQRVERLFSSEAHSTAMLNIYEEVLAQSKRRG